MCASAQPASVSRCRHCVDLCEMILWSNPVAIQGEADRLQMIRDHFRLCHFGLVKVSSTINSLCVVRCDKVGDLLSSTLGAGFLHQFHQQRFEGVPPCERVKLLSMGSSRLIVLERQMQRRSHAINRRFRPLLRRAVTLSTVRNDERRTQTITHTVRDRRPGENSSN